MRLYISILFGTFISVALGLAVFNIIVDSANLFRPGLERRIAKQVVRGNMVQVSQVISEARLNREIIDLLPDPPDSIAIGSSRIMSLRDEDLACRTFINHGVDAAILEDYYAVLGMYAGKLQLPGEVIIAVDPWIFNINRVQSRWQDTAEDATFMASLVGGDHITTRYYSYRELQAIFSFQYAQENYKYLLQGGQDQLHGMEVIVEQKVPDDGYILHGDGSVQYRFGGTDQDPDETYKEAEAFSNRYPIYSLQDFDAIDEAVMSSFYDLVHYLLNNDVQVVILLPPYHPLVYEMIKMDPRYHQVLKVEKMLRAMEGVVVVGSYDPAECGYRNEDFYDGIHPKSLAAIVESLNEECEN